VTGAYGIVGGLTNSGELVTNGGPFTSTTGWLPQSGNVTLSFADGNLVSTPNTTTQSRADTPISMTVGKWYALTVIMLQFSGAGATLALLTARNGGLVPGTTVSEVVGLTKFKFIATTTQCYLTFGSNVPVSGVADILSSATIKEILPSTHGRIILRDTPTARQLELCQGLANRLAGL
jgi:hypothetical protein